MTSTRRKLLENFDDEVRDKLKIRDADTKVYLNRFEQNLMKLAHQELGKHAHFIDSSSFRLNDLPDWLDSQAIPTGLYELPRRTGEAHLFRANHPLGEAIVARARNRELVAAELTFDLTGHEGRVSQIDPFKGQSGWLQAKLFTVHALGQSEDYLLLAGISDGGTVLSDEATSRMMTVGGNVGAEVALPTVITAVLNQSVAEQQVGIRRKISERNARFFEKEADKLDGWADDLKVGLEREIKEIDRQIKEARRAATAALSLEEKLAGQKAVKALEFERNGKRRSLFDAQDKIDEERSRLIATIEGRLEQNVLKEDLFTIRWSVI